MLTKTKDIISQCVIKGQAEVINIRRHLHAHPELSFEESQTAAFIAEKLTSYGIPFQSNVAGHGIVALIEGTQANKACIALRADMDALPINEQNNVPYRSLIAGKMHACGHDAHTAMLLGAAKILIDLKDLIKGTVKLIFQPAEEKLPGGAKAMIEAGVLKHPTVNAIVGLHVLPELPAGMLGFHAGPFMASGDEINIRIKGKGGHAAMPHLITDNLLVAAHLITQLQTITSRFAPPLIPTVLSFGRMIADGAHNIIPDEVLIQGTFRTFDEKWRSEAKQHIRRIAAQTAKAMGAEADVHIEDGYPVLLNDKELTNNLLHVFKDFFVGEELTELPQRLTTEDFAWYSHQIPACFMRLGTAFPDESEPRPLHTSTFDINENSLQTGTKALVVAALSLLTHFEKNH